MIHAYTKTVHTVCRYMPFMLIIEFNSDMLLVYFHTMLSTLNITKVYYLLLDLSFLDGELERNEVRMWLFCLSSWGELSSRTYHFL